MYFQRAERLEGYHQWQGGRTLGVRVTEPQCQTSNRNVTEMPAERRNCEHNPNFETK